MRWTVALLAALLDRVRRATKLEAPNLTVINMEMLESSLVHAASQGARARAESQRHRAARSKA